ncbi:radical SAM family heme chaperone HemW [Caulobacter sp. S45]|uniref:radical SAM family heme chaperone HemW n=1 Tax=Caulobacter sp. S45 TaxID=1641861 RepID=UPI00157568E9|nr:radical SAM family heme chaperone HemW [Caulobacter sp. S45]
MTVAPAPLGVYIHWPYCARICPYCDFNVVRDRGRSAAGEALVDAIAADLFAQAALIAVSSSRSVDLVSIYFGGGTPSLMRPSHVERLIRSVRSLWTARGSVEVTLEANPADADPARFQAFAAAGVNRLSLGVQSFDDHALSFLRRDHDAAQAGAALAHALAAFPRVSLDLIYALPGQTPDDWRHSLQAAASLGASHVSAYQLTLEPGTPFARAAQRGTLAAVEDELGAAFYDVTVDTLGRAGFTAYEVSNFAQGAEARSRHNLVYWRGESYVGVGPGAHGRLVLEGRRTATEAEPRVQAYMDRVVNEGAGWRLKDPMASADVLEERVLMGLRIAEGVEMADIAELGRTDALAPLVAAGWLAAEAGRIRATRAGRLLLDSVTGALLA